MLAMLILAIGCAGRATPGAAPTAFRLPANVTVTAGPDGRPIDSAELLRRLTAADIVLLGELHDNAVHHAVRGQLIAALQSSRPAILFEQFAETTEPIAPPPGAQADEAWLDRNGFDRQSWRWPLHQPVVDAAIRHGRSLWGSGITREALRTVVRSGESSAPAHLRALLGRVPLDGAAQTALDRELVAGHCGQLPESMVPGMRAAQTVRDAAMANALLKAQAGGPAWLIAGNGHVRRDIAVPRLLSVLAPNLDVLVVGFVERSATGAEPGAAERALYDLVVVTPRATRPDPCAGFQVR